MFLTESQKNYYTAMKKLGTKKPQKVIQRPKNEVHALFYDISLSRRYKLLSIFISSLLFWVISDGKYFNWFNQNSMHFRFEIAIFILIFLNMVTMGIEHYNQSRAFTFTLEITNALFVTIFALGKLVGHLNLTVHISKLYLIE